MKRLFAPLFRARTWSASLHLLLDLPFGIAWFVITIVGLSLGVGLVPIGPRRPVGADGHGVDGQGDLGRRARQGQGSARRHGAAARAPRRGAGRVVAADAYVARTTRPAGRGSCTD